MTAPSASRTGLSKSCNVRVDLGPKSYDVVIGRGLLDRVGEMMQSRGLEGAAAIIVDEAVESNYLPAIQESLKNAGINSFAFIVPAGEKSKSMEQVGLLLSKIAATKLSRAGMVMAIGGGVIGDLAGFVAATYLRGVAFIQVPTTLLAMVDSSVGGKTGVNLPEGKNLAGAFHQPKLVVADLDTLKTLPPREFSAGMAEVIKYGAIKDKALFDRVANGVKPEDADLDEIVEKCVAIKARVVENDEFETKGARALLNFGHTIGHAIEGASHYETYLHGEAIAIGMRAAAWLSHFHPETKLPKETVFAIEGALKANDLPVKLERTIISGQIFNFLASDKKTKEGTFRWVLLNEIGKSRSGYIMESVPTIERVIGHLFEPKGTDLIIPKVTA